jgi:hypothetical protein
MLSPQMSHQATSELARALLLALVRGAALTRPRRSTTQATKALTAMNPRMSG